MTSKSVTPSELVTTESLRQRIARNLTLHDRRVASSMGLRPAAVAVALVTDAVDRECFVLIRRAPGRGLEQRRGTALLPRHTPALLPLNRAAAQTQLRLRPPPAPAA